MYAARAWPPLLANLRAAMKGQALTRYQPQKLNLLSCGGRHVIAIWGGISFEGAWVSRWQDRIDRRFVAAYAAFIRR